MILRLSLYKTPFRLLFCKRRRAPKSALDLNGSRKAKNPRAIFFDLKISEPLKILVSLFDANSVEKSAHSDFDKILSSFYTDWFTKDSTIDMQIQTKIIDDLKLSLTDLERESFEGLISTDELFVALKGLQNGKAPGFDDLPAEFYLFFFSFFFLF